MVHKTLCSSNFQSAASGHCGSRMEDAEFESIFHEQNVPPFRRGKPRGQWLGLVAGKSTAKKHLVVADASARKSVDLAAEFTVDLDPHDERHQTSVFQDGRLFESV